jgi:MoxR-like ATPase
MKPNEKFEEIEKELNKLFQEREEVIHGMALSILSGNNMLLLGPPGTAKSMTVRAWKDRVTGASNYFEYLLTKFSTPEEIFGTFSLKALEEDRYTRITTNKLPEANFGFLDEIFKCNSGLLNSMLTVLNERVFYNDGKPHKIPLLAVIAASNETPEEEDGLAALYDRFLLKFTVKPIQEDSNFMRMLTAEFNKKPEATISFKEIQGAIKEVETVEVNEGMVGVMLKIRRALAQRGIAVTDRTFNTAMKIVKAEAYLSGREEVIEGDFSVLRHVLWTDPKDEREVWGIILNVVSPGTGEILDTYERALETYNKVANEENKNKKTDMALDTFHKLKTALTTIDKIISEMKAKKKDVTEALRYREKIHDFQQKAFFLAGFQNMGQ